MKVISAFILSSCVTVVALRPSISRRHALARLSGASMAVVGASLPVSASNPVQYGDESIMSKKVHGTSESPVQSSLQYGVDTDLADRICNYNRRFAERAGYFVQTEWPDVVLSSKEPVTYYDSVTGLPLFRAPVGRSAEDFLREAETHGWPSFRDQEVIWENVRVLRDSGETVSLTGTHLGHNIPDRKGNRYCINLVSIAGKPTASGA